jgi:hypothetical protein
MSLTQSNKTFGNCHNRFKVSILPYIAIGLFLFPTLYWIWFDHSVWPWDQAWYGEVSTDLWLTLSYNPRQWVGDMLRAFGIKAPGIGWVGQLFAPIGSLANSPEFGLLLLILAAQFITLALCHQIGREFFPDSYGMPLLGALFMASCPLFIGMGRQYFVDALQLLSVSYFYWIATFAQRFSRVQILGHLSLAAGAAALIKVSSPLYCLFPGLLAVYYLFVSPNWFALGSRRRFTAQICLILGGVSLTAAALAWYARNFAAVYAFMKSTSSGEVALHYGREAAFLNKMGFWLASFQKSFFLPEVLVAITLLVLVIVILPAARRQAIIDRIRYRNLRILSGLATLQFFGVLVVFSLNINEESRYMLPLLPSVVIVGYWGARHANRRLLCVGLSFILLYQWGLVNLQSLGLTPPSPRMSHWVLPLNPDKQTMIELEKLVAYTCHSKTGNRYSVVGVELPWLNANTLSFYAAKARLKERAPRCKYTSLGYAAKDMDVSWTRICALDPAYFISLEETAQPTPPDFHNQLSVPMLQRIRADKEWIQVPFKSHFGIVVFQKVAVN